MIIAKDVIISGYRRIECPNCMHEFKIKLDDSCLINLPEFDLIPAAYNMYVKVKNKIIQLFRKNHHERTK